MNRFLLFLFFLCVVNVVHAQANKTGALVTQGVELHDKGDYEGAIKKYDEALQVDSTDYDANYEKSLSCLYAKRYDECIAISEYLLNTYPDSASNGNLYSNCGSAWDDKGNAEKALEVYDEGLKKFPGYYLLYFNRGLTLGGQKKWEDALADFLKTLQLKPDHKGSLYYTSLTEENYNQTAALLSGMVFLAAEPEGKRAKYIFDYLFELLDSFARKDDDKGSTIFFDQRNEKENDFSTVQLMLGISAVAYHDSSGNYSVVKRLTDCIGGMVELFKAGQEDGKGIFWKTYVPFFIEMDAKNLVTSFSHIACITSGDEANVKWIGDNQDKIAAFYTWFSHYTWHQ